MPDQEGRPPDREWKPVPDPTALTNELVRVAVLALEEKLSARQDGLREAIEARLLAMDKANQLAEATVTRVPTLLDKEMVHQRTLVDARFITVESKLVDLSALRDEKLQRLQELMDERFSSIQTQFNERDTRTEQISQANKQAIDAALSAAEKAVNKQADAFSIASSKTEANFTKQIDQLADLLKANTTSLDDKINDAKDRLNRIEGAASSRTETKTEQHTSSSFIVTIIMALIAAAALFGRFLTGGH